MEIIRTNKTMHLLINVYKTFLYSLMLCENKDTWLPAYLKMAACIQFKMMECKSIIAAQI